MAKGKKKIKKRKCQHEDKEEKPAKQQRAAQARAGLTFLIGKLK